MKNVLTNPQSKHYRSHNDDINRLEFMKEISEYGMQEDSGDFIESALSVMALEKGQNMSKRKHQPRKHRRQSTAPNRIANNVNKQQSEKAMMIRQLIDSSKAEFLRGRTKQTIGSQKQNMVSLKQRRWSSKQTLKRSNKCSLKRTEETLPNNTIIQFEESRPTKIQQFIQKYHSKSNKIRRASVVSLSDKQHQQIDMIVHQLKRQNNPKDEDQTFQVQVPPPDILDIEGNMINKEYMKNDRRPRVYHQRQVKPHSLLKERYQILERIGKGLSGEVFKAKDILADRLVAIKVLDIKSDTGEYNFYRKFQHRNIVTYYNNFIEQEKRFLILEYLPHTLQTAAKLHKFSLEEVRKIFTGVASGLAFLHGISIAHRDIKMENIVVSTDFSLVKLIDFGLCLDLSEHSTTSNQFCGTLHYMPPQVLKGLSYCPLRADIWSLGVLLYKLVCDRFPYRGKDQRDQLIQISNSKVRFPQTMNGDLKNLLSSLLQRDKNKRPTAVDICTNRWLTSY